MILDEILLKPRSFVLNIYDLGYNLERDSHLDVQYLYYFGKSRICFDLFNFVEKICFSCSCSRPQSWFVISARSYYFLWLSDNCSGYFKLESIFSYYFVGSLSIYYYFKTYYLFFIYYYFYCDLSIYLYEEASEYFQLGQISLLLYFFSGLVGSISSLCYFLSYLLLTLLDLLLYIYFY